MKTIFNVLALLALLAGGVYLGSAQQKDPDAIGRDIAQAYLDAGAIDENWRTSHPFLTADATYITDKPTPAYKEYKVSCDGKPDC